MIIDFPNIPEQRLPNFKGGEKEYIARMFFDGQNRIMYGRLEPGASIGLHTHETSSEIMYFLEGRGKVLLADGEERVAATRIALSTTATPIWSSLPSYPSNE